MSFNVEEAKTEMALCRAIVTATAAEDHEMAAKIILAHSDVARLTAVMASLVWSVHALWADQAGRDEDESWAALCACISSAHFGDMP